MIAVGYQMRYRIPINRLKPIVFGLTLKLIVVPFVALVIYKSYGSESIALKVSVLQSGMPPMVTAGVLAMAANIENEIAAALVGYGLLFSFLTLPVVYFFI